MYNIGPVYVTFIILMFVLLISAGKYQLFRFVVFFSLNKYFDTLFSIYLINNYHKSFFFISYQNKMYKILEKRLCFILLLMLIEKVCK